MCGQGCKTSLVGSSAWRPSTRSGSRRDEKPNKTTYVQVGRLLLKGRQLVEEVFKVITALRLGAHARNQVIAVGLAFRRGLDAGHTGATRKGKE